jgi:hypothetical protein
LPDRRKESGLPIPNHWALKPFVERTQDQVIGFRLLIAENEKLRFWYRCAPIA